MKTWQKLRNDPSLWNKYFVREKVIKDIRSFFEKENFHEVEAPLMTARPAAESYLDVFKTTLLDRNRNPKDAYLYTSPEMPLKKLLVAGIGNCYSLTKAFRNMETKSRFHNPEFTVLEWYRVNARYTDIMNDCEKLLRSIAGDSITYQGKTIDCAMPWERITVAEAFEKYANVNFDDFFDHAAEIAQKKGYTIEKGTTWEELYNQIFLNEVESHLGVDRPTILYEYPAAVAALSNKKATDPRYCERFEFYIAGMELGDAYDELTDPVEIEKRFEGQMREIERLEKTSYEYDQDFIEALKVGMPRCSGIAVGVDRLIMLLTDSTDIADTLFFPAKELFDEQ